MIGRPAIATLLLAVLPWLYAGAASDPALRVNGRVVDAVTRMPIPGAILTTGDKEIRSDPQGFFLLDVADVEVVRVRAPGYLRADAPVQALRTPEAEVRLTPFRPKALYLSLYGVGDRKLRTAALALLETTELNALVIDLKGDGGLVPYRSAIALATQVGARRVTTISDLPALVTGLRQRGVYTIARIVVFKDNLLALGEPVLAVRGRDGSIFRDREGLAWTNPYSRDVWTYNIDIAVEAAKAGVDEIQFDYVRFPDATGLAYEMPWTEQNRVAAIDGFLGEARTRLTPFNVFLAADVFGYICWNTNDTRIGQQLEHLAGIVDYLSPMLYPSSFQFGIPGYRNPVDHPYQIVRLSLDHARERSQLPPVRFRPWLQAFRDYAFGGRPFTAGEIRTQITAAEDFGADGWMLWNPRNKYSAVDLRPRSTEGDHVRLLRPSTGVSPWLGRPAGPAGRCKAATTMSSVTSEKSSKNRPTARNSDGACRQTTSSASARSVAIDDCGATPRATTIFLGRRARIARIADSMDEPVATPSSTTITTRPAGSIGGCAFV